MKMNNRLRNILAAGILAASVGCYHDKVKDERETGSKNLETKIASSAPAQVDTVYVEDFSHYSKWVGRRMKTYDGETGLKGTLEFITYGVDEYILIKKKYWQNEIKGKTVPVYNEVYFYASFEKPRTLNKLEIATIFDDWYATHIELDRETAGNSQAFKRAEELFLECLDALENPTINGRLRVASIADGGI